MLFSDILLLNVYLFYREREERERECAHVRVGGGAEGETVQQIPL